jgi:hypothetical protein
MQTTTLNKANIVQLEAEIRDLIEPERQSFVAIFSERIERQINHFLAKRKPNQFLEEFYLSVEGGIPEGVRESLILDEQVVRERRFYIRDKNRADFGYHRSEQADAIIRKIAERNADDVLQTFISRTMSKLSHVVARKGDFTVVKNTAGHSGYARAAGHWEGVLVIDFEDGTSLSANLTIITNFSKYGRPFGQYPMRFFNCVLSPGAAYTASSIEEIWASVGYVPAPPSKKPRWAKVVSGSVLLANGTHHLVATPSKLAKMGLTDYEQVARIETFDHHARIEHQDSRVERYNFTEGERAQLEALEKAYKFTKATALRKELTFQALFGEAIV